MTKTKSLARMYVWWLSIDKDIERSVQECMHCQQQYPDSRCVPLQPWKWPSRPWVRLHMDFAGPFEGKIMILVAIDSHSKWIEAFVTNGATSQVVIELSRTLFAQFGIPEVVVTDNGSCFVSEDFGTFLVTIGIKHVTSAPYHPSTNGLNNKEGTEEKQTRKFIKLLISYPQGTTGESPFQLLFGQQIRTRLDLIKPCIDSHVEQQLQQQKTSHDRIAKEKEFCKGERVYVRNFGQGSRWLSAVIEEVTGPVSYVVRLEDNGVDVMQIIFVGKRQLPALPLWMQQKLTIWKIFLIVLFCHLQTMQEVLPLRPVQM